MVLRPPHRPWTSNSFEDTHGQGQVPNVASCPAQAWSVCRSPLHRPPSLAIRPSPTTPVSLRVPRSVLGSHPGQESPVSTSQARLEESQILNAGHMSCSAAGGCGDGGTGGERGTHGRSGGPRRGGGVHKVARKTEDSEQGAQAGPHGRGQPARVRPAGGLGTGTSSASGCLQTTHRALETGKGRWGRGPSRALVTSHGLSWDCSPHSPCNSHLPRETGVIGSV